MKASASHTLVVGLVLLLPMMGLLPKAALAGSGVPDQPLWFTGVLLDEFGHFSGDAVVDLTVLDGQPDAGSICEDVNVSILVTAGRFEVAIPDDCVEAIATSGQTSSAVEIEAEFLVDGETVVFPAQRLRAVPYALSSTWAYRSTDFEVSGKLTIPEGALTNGSVTGVDIKNGSITGTDIEDGSIMGKDIADGTIGSSDILNNSINGIDISEDLTLTNLTIPAAGKLDVNGNLDLEVITRSATGPLVLYCAAGETLLNGGCSCSGSAIAVSLPGPNSWTCSCGTGPPTTSIQCIKGTASYKVGN